MKMRFPRPAVLFSALAFLLAPGFLRAQAPLASEDLARALAEEISGEIAYRYTDAISRFDRVQASSGWHDAAVWIQAELARLGYRDVALEGWPSDGSRRYGTYRSVIGWRAKSAELWMTSPRRERLCSFEEVPLTLVKHSGPGHVETELVDVGSGSGEEAYRGRDVKGRIVLATGATAGVMNEAVLKRGAAGVLTYFAPDTRPGYPNMIRYTALWPRWKDREKLGFAFNISKNQGAVLKRLLEEGQKVVLKADVDTEFFPTEIETLSAVFPGSEEPDREVVVVGHLCHPAPSANDNASGSGGMLEMARAFKKLVASGKLPAPRRTIRFLWVPEFNGLMPYVVAHADRTRRSLAAINCDMIGEDLHKTGGTLSVFKAPDSRPTYLNDLAGDFAALAGRLELRSLNGSDHPFAWRMEDYGGGSDHVVFNDGSLGVASVMLNRGDTFHHTSLDTMDKVDPTELRRSCFIALGAAYYIAAAGEPEARATARLVARNGLARLGGNYYDALAVLERATDGDALLAAYRRLLNVVAHAARREADAILSVRAFVKDALPKDIAGARGQLDTLALSLPKEAYTVYQRRCLALGIPPRKMVVSEEERRLGRMVPSRAPDFIGPLETDLVEEKLGAGSSKALELPGDLAYEALNFVDGKRSLYDIALALDAEYGFPEPGRLTAFFEVLEKAGLVVLKRT
jgi:hypothetical protein